jgi:hypothetical protein
MTQEMKDWFRLRTGLHLWLVNKWHDRIARYCAISDVPGVDIARLDQERMEHDEHKWHEPEYTPYVYITWKYKCKREGKDFEVPPEIANAMHEATWHHIKNHKHHPEYWDGDCTIDCLNAVDRDKPAAQMVDGTKMPLTYVACMMADWFAMSEELRTDLMDWMSKNVNTRWSFTVSQIALMNRLKERVWDNYPKT